MNAPPFLLSKDAITVQRMSSSTDAEGNTLGNLTTVYEGRGTFFALTARDIADAGIRRTLIDAGIAVKASIDIQAADLVTTPTGSNFEVVSVENRRMHKRVLMRKAS